MEFQQIKVEAFSFPSFCDDFDPECMADMITPTKAKTVKPPLFVDEDSGLGLEYDAKDNHACSTISHNESPSKQDETTPMSYSMRRFSRRKRCLLNGGESGSITKKRQRRYKPSNGPRFSKCLSFHDNVNNKTEADVSDVVEKFVAEENLIGNGTRSFCLPTVPGRHSDLKSITPATLADLLTGRYDDVITSYRIIDCRYPYEYIGGHIKGAENRYSQEQILELLENGAAICEEKKNILVFHCEFSSERGPKMCRFLRNKDREMNKDQYPHLNFPEIYLLHDGYKAVFEFKKELCEPMTYTPMLHSSHSEELRHFRAKSKSFCNGQKRRRRYHRLVF